MRDPTTGLFFSHHRQGLRWREVEYLSYVEDSREAETTLMDQW